MTPSDPQRLALRQRLIDVLDEQPAMTLMESLPPMDWNELATKSDLAVLKSDLAALEERMTAKFEVVDARFDGRFEAIDGRFEAMGDKIDKGFAEVGGEAKSDIGRVHRDIARLTYVILAGFAAAVTPIYLALFAGLGG